mmetsp:Transcript_43788/g.64314  ORF Transcript_43788/g.64314 Transcript_43788/m.64314 type:complete len:1235 (+) Transcript_43788:138-3842(+)|eukprot:CAMPEP_0195516400 /NCGR_PEP_ID=MMETSP0794_2-20130614/7137_1 /TAXON_ID=515487 /ORGANISM="Stephanopyxis turris, Strain CCMP 815" /LENGTH=1234 /DNA_ID=CAMNT_0040644985 /DNA_START=95 /DNA_END=3802 /DNA_ORIENTATION=+
MNAMKQELDENPNKEEGGIATVIFRVKGETLDYGESVFLVSADDPTSIRGIPLFTTAATHPWYSVRTPLSITLPPENDMNSKNQKYAYRYAVYRAGTFHRFENSSDGPKDAGSIPRVHPSTDTISMYDEAPNPERTPKTQLLRHEIPLRLLSAGESYVVQDVLGYTTGKPDIEKITVSATIPNADSMLSRPESNNSSGNLLQSSGSGVNLQRNNSGDWSKKKKVNFAPAPVPSKPQLPKPTKIGEGVNLSSSDGVVVASAFLPVSLHRSEEGEWTANWVYDALLSMETHLRVTRVGTVKWRGWHGNVGGGGSSEAGVPVEEREKVERCLRDFNCVPVWCDPVQFGEMYNGFCKGVLWPVLHNVTSVYSSSSEGGSNNPDIGGGGGGGAETMSSFNDNSMSSSSSGTQFSEYCTDDVAIGPIHGDSGREAAMWSAYTAINRQFADIMIQCFNEGDLVWIHGFHLMILPSYLIRRIPMAKIGLFLHTPFPSSEIFRTLWCREELLRGMLNADQVGFHLFEYARHFLTSCRRLLGLTYGMVPDAHGGYNLAIETNGRNVGVSSIHAGIEPPIVNQFLYHSVTTEKAYMIQNQFKGKVIFCAIDRLESLKGTPLKMLGIERFLHRCPEWIGKIVLLQVGISAFERGDDYFKTKSEVLQMVENINGRWPGTIQFQECAESDMTLQQRMALLRAADVCMVTSLRDGLNRIPLEFTMAHLDALTEAGRRDGRKRGLCILSEFSSCTRVMRGALHVNPWKISQIANAFQQALTMSEDERMRRITTASEFVTRVTTQRWALAVLLDLKGVQKNIDIGNYSGAGLGLGYRILGMDTGFNSLDPGTVAKSYKNTRSRLILLDYGGTIVGNDNLDSLSRYMMVKRRCASSLPTDGLVSTLTELCSDKRNTVFVVSGKERHSLSKTLGHIPHLGLAAEHGMFISWPTSKTTGKRKWSTIIPEQDRTWRSLAITIMEVYTSRTHGSYIEETEMKVLWQYRDADPEFGYLQSKELEDHLSNVLRGFSVEVLHGGKEEGGYVEVRPKGVNKGVLSMHVISKLKKKIDFALALGDDHCDEPMLSVMRQIGRRAYELRHHKEPPLAALPATVTLVDVSSVDEHVAPDLQVFTCTVGKKPSAAANYLNDVGEVYELLYGLNKIRARENQYLSAVDLRTLVVKPDAPEMLALESKNLFTAGNNPTSLLGLSGVKRSMSMGSMYEDKKEEKKVSSSLNQFLGTIEADDDEEAFFF